MTQIEVLQTMIETSKERGAQYGNDFKQIGKVMKALFPAGVQLHTEEDFVRWYLFEMTVAKNIRFAVSGLTHRDSVHDMAVYGAMGESCLTPETMPITMNSMGKQVG
jgi:hypothetical protein